MLVGKHLQFLNPSTDHSLKQLPAFVSLLHLQGRPGQRGDTPQALVSTARDRLNFSSKLFLDVFSGCEGPLV